MMGPSAGPSLTPPITTDFMDMTDLERAEALARLAEELARLMTSAERRDYPVLSHLTDLIDDLEMEP